MNENMQSPIEEIAMGQKQSWQGSRICSPQWKRSEWARRSRVGRGSSWVHGFTLLILKMYIIAVITGQIRLRKNAFANPEDAMRHGGIQYYRQDPDVERYRRAHNNDMENIYPFLFLGAVYSLLSPNPTIARIHFQIFFICRVLHTVAYVLALKPPTRSVAYIIAQLPCFSMVLQILYSVASFW